ncbi:PQQ-binding-like beta-propeller repeat protein [Halostagnicola larsenii]|uniref:PQQ-binding-like beta-propeller repeat protein n=1 Tax=Halostagnicola larsenii TaxID=353800 RepID=UPI0009FC10EB|nr:PQQ-binding-like beta-propeller repeat protein [Halostagnicola larsenii]
MALQRRNLLTAIGAGVITTFSGCINSFRETNQPKEGDWTQISKNSQHTGSDTSVPGISEGDIHWEVEFDSNVDLIGISVTDDQIILADNQGVKSGSLHKISLSDGDIKDTYDLSTKITSPPVISNNSILTITNARDEISILNAFDYNGTEQWGHQIYGRLPSAPTIYQSTVYSGDQNGVVYSLEEATGVIHWERQFGDDNDTGSIPAPPTVDGTGVYISVDGSSAQGIYSLSPKDGEIQWSVEGPQVPSVMTRTGDLLLASYSSYELVAFDIHTGKRRWSTSLSKKDTSSPAVAEEIIVIADEEQLYGLDLETGEKQWSLQCNPQTTSQPIIAGNTAITNTEDGLVSCSVSSGERLWSLDNNSTIPLVAVENGILISPESNVLSVYTSY